LLKEPREVFCTPITEIHCSLRAGASRDFACCIDVGQCDPIQVDDPLGAFQLRGRFVFLLLARAPFPALGISRASFPPASLACFSRILPP